ncbi:serine hydrolase [Burkholderia multivorans]|uniref:serine hydrolase domain-containing protein n=1 Tax=Burkholderia multivorans TaxID=87883 RepID=UPI000CFEDDF5|nr:serine hydrolase [Burkholderia multivorans]MDN8004440.1 serine hydrolase [Burkholderia multivorans]PRH02260.1 serine hydrolase [Burkholderia multivorans]
MTIPLTPLIRRGIALALIAAIGYAGYQLSRLAPIATGYAAKALCSGVFVSGRPAASVIDVDIMAGVHPLLKLVRPSIDAEHYRAHATFAGFAARDAEFRPGLGCTLALGPAAAALPAALPPLPAAPAATAVPASLAIASEPASASSTTSAPTGVDMRKLHTALDRAFDEPDPARPRRTRAVVVMWRGRVIAERYAPGFTGDTPLPGWSMTKTVTAVLIGMLVGQHRLSPDTAALLPEWRGAGDPRAAITLDDLLRMTSGLQFNEDYDDPLSDVAVMLFTQRDTARFASNKPLAAAPGTRWDYSSGTSEIVARVMRVALGGSTDDYLSFPRRALFAPLGMRSAVFEPDASGTLAAASFMYASARDWARFGQFLLQDGVWNGQRLLPEGWVRYLARATPQSSRAAFGAHLWVKVPEPFDDRDPHARALPADAFHAVGHEGQFVSVVPSRDLVVVRLGLSRPESAWNHEAFLARVLDAIPASGT